VQTREDLQNTNHKYKSKQLKDLQVGMKHKHSLSFLMKQESLC